MRVGWRVRRRAARDAREVARDAPDGTPVTDLLFDRLTGEDVGAIRAALTDDEAAVWESASPHDRRWIALALGAHHRVPAVTEKTGLTPDQPPEDVHAMSRGALAAGGSAGYADLVAGALETAGKPIGPGQSVLDFGCSSGRVVRVLAAAFPETRWHGCDPNEAAIEWARVHLPGIDFSQSPQEPPLPYADASFAAVYAISVWSHFDQELGVRWLDEMHRLLAPGGVLLLTTHGWHSIAHYLQNGLRTKEQLTDIARALRREGFWYRAEFGEAGDFGVRNPQWGTAFMTGDWLLAKTAGKWQPAAFASGAVEDNQDLVLLVRA